MYDPEDNTELISLFPLIHPEIQWRKAARLIAHEATRRGLQPLRPNHARFFDQPYGYMRRVFDVELTTGVMDYHVGLTFSDQQFTFHAPARLVRETRRLLRSEGYRRIPREHPQRGCDGGTVLIESHLDGEYLWKCYWSWDARQHPLWDRVVQSFWEMRRSAYPNIAELDVAPGQAPGSQLEFPSVCDPA
jgi:hypothetical protein